MAMTGEAGRVLLVDDDTGIRSAVGDFLSGYGFQVVSVGDAQSADRELARQKFDVAVLDVMLPGEDGLSLCRRLRARGNMPIIMISAAGDTTDRIIGIETGADAYLPKPCSPHELLAHVRQAMRRAIAPDVPEARYGFAGLVLDPVARRLTRDDGVVIHLSAGEYALLRVFLDKPNRVLSRELLLEEARGPESDALDRAIDVQVYRLRRKIDRGAGAELIRTVRAEGYMFTGRVDRL